MKIGESKGTDFLLIRNLSPSAIPNKLTVRSGEARQELQADGDFYKQCSKCKKKKLNKDYYKKSNGILFAHCKECFKKYQKFYYKNNRNIYQEYYKKNRKKIKKYLKNYCFNYYRKNKKKILKYNKEYLKIWRKNNQDKINKYLKDYFKHHPWYISYRAARERCLNPKHIYYKNYGGKGIKFLMTPIDFKELWFRDKAYLMKKPSIDRINSNNNYEINNCRFIEKTENSRLGHLKIGGEECARNSIF